MEFVHPSLLAGLVAVAVPVLVHLIFRRRARPVAFGTLRFLKLAVRHDVRRRRLKRWLLLALRVGCVVAAALLFARPYFDRPTGGGGDGGLTVVLLDRSASMARLQGGRRLVDLALDKLPEITAGRRDRARVAVAWFDATTVATDAGAVVAPETLVGATDFAAALMWAASRCEAARGGGPLVVHVVTDLQRTGFGDLDGFRFPADVPVRVWDVGPAPTANVAVTDARPASLMVMADRPTTVTATILNARPEPLVQRPVRLTLTNGAKSITRPGAATAAPGGVATVTFDTPPLGPGLWAGAVSVEGGDALPVDDVRHLAIYAASKPRALVLDGAARDVAILGEAYFLEAALRLAPPGGEVIDGPFVVKTAAYGPGARLPDLGDTDTLVMANVAGFSGSDAARVKAFLERGGAAVVFGGGNLRPESSAGYAAAGLSVGGIGEPHLARDTPFRVGEFDAAHPALAPFADPQHGDLRWLLFSGCTGVAPAEGARVLASLRDGSPLLLERGPRVVWCAASAGNEHGAWSRSRLFLPLVHQLVRAAAGQAGSGPVVEVAAGGEAPGVRRNADGWEVRNLDPRESELERCTPEEFARRLGLMLAVDDTDAPAAGAEGPGDESRPGELWPWAWLVLVGCWLAAGLVADRTVA